MAVAAEQVGRRWASSTAIYGVVSISLVVLAWESDGGHPWDLPELILAYMVLLLLTHTYAQYAASGVKGSWPRAFWHELPVAAGGVAALIVSVITATANVNDDTASGLALAACGLTLVAMQVAILRPAGASRAQVVRTLVYDVTAGAIVIFLHIIIE